MNTLHATPTPARAKPTASRTAVGIGSSELVRLCPFCGGTGKAVAMQPIANAAMAFMHVECQSCGASGPTAAGVNPERAIRFWNGELLPNAPLSEPPSSPENNIPREKREA